MLIETFIEKMPKVELHVHIEGAIQPETLLLLAKRNKIDLPARNIDELRKWYAFTDFSHFIQVYFKASECIQTPDDVELVVYEFLKNQAAQNIRYTEGTWTPYTHVIQKDLSFEDQIGAIERARLRARDEWGVELGIVIDLSRGGTGYEESLMIAEWAASAKDRGVVAFGIGGMETGYPASLFEDAFAYAKEHGLASVPHAGEVVGPESIWDALKTAQPDRIYHGVRAIEDPELVAHLREKQIPLDICPTSNICLGVVPDMQSHMLPRLVEEGLYITINSDDPPMFGTTLTHEFQEIARVFGYDAAMIQQFVMNGVEAALLPQPAKDQMRADFLAEFAMLHES